MKSGSSDENLDARKATASGIPQEVVEAHVLGNDSLLKAWREYLGVDRKELADRLGVSPATVAKYENSDVPPPPETLKEIGAALALNEAQLS